MQEFFKDKTSQSSNDYGEVPSHGMVQAIIERSGLEAEWIPAFELVRLNRWCEDEKSRLCALGHSEFSGKSDVLLELVDIVNGPLQDRAQLDAFIANNPGVSLQEILFSLVTESRQRAISDFMRARGKKKSEAASVLLKKVGWRWLEYKLGLVDGRQHSKNSATEPLSKEFNKSPAYIRDTYLRGVERRKDVFPDGVAAAEMELKRRYGVSGA